MAANKMKPLASKEVIDMDKEPVVGLTVEQNFTYANYTLFAVQIILIFLLGGCAKDSFLPDVNFASNYSFFTGVEIMMFIGFGYLMTFLKRYGMGAVGLTMLVTVVALQWGVFTEWFFAMWCKTGAWTYIPMNILTLDTGLTLVATLLISFGGLIGTISPLQLVIMTLLECVFYSINKSIFLVNALQFTDAGGTIQIHMFGAYFGLAASYVLGMPKRGTEGEVNHVSDVFSLIGTLFLWIYWPSFNGGELEPGSDQQQRAVVHTILSLCAATVGTFVTSSYLNSTGKFRPVDIQNATLAGGVAIGATCNFTMTPSDPLIVGLVAGCLSAYGFARIQPLLESYGLHDSCGINNLHGMPSLLGGAVSVLLCAFKGPRGHDMPAVFHHAGQAGIQLAAIVITLLIAISSGVLTGLVMRKYGSCVEDFTDFPYWEVEEWSAEEGHGAHAPAAADTEAEDLEQGVKAGSSVGYDKLARDSEEGEEMEHVKL